MNVFELTKTLVNIPSISGNENALFQKISEILKKEGFHIQKIEVQKGRPNLFAYIDKPRILFSSHLDTVPPFISFREDERFIYGRGACDAKGVIAAQMMAGFELKKKGYTNIGFLYVIGEEVDHSGAKEVSKHIPNVKAIIMGEPTDNELAVGTKGILKIILNAKGNAAHSAYPHLGKSAIHLLLQALDRLQMLRFEKDHILGASTMNIGIIKGGIADNILAPEAFAHVLIRTSIPSKKVQKKIKKCFASSTFKNISIIIESMNDPIKLDHISGFPKKVVAFNTDLPYLNKKAKKLFLFGPGSILDAHTSYERISKKELQKGVEFYKKIVLRIMN